MILKPLVIYHKSCIDGFGAALAAHLRMGDAAEYVPVQYEYTELPDFKGRNVYLLDFSFRREDMDRLFAEASRVVWLDHHASAFKMFDPDGYAAMGKSYNLSSNEGGEDGKRIQIRLDSRKSGAMLAWEFFHLYGSRAEFSGDPLWVHAGMPPMIFKYIDDYDRWQFKLPDSKAFDQALRSLPQDFDQWRSVTWLTGYPDRYGNDQRELDKFIDQGKAILRIHQQNVEATLADNARPCAIAIRFSGTPTARLYPGWAANCLPNLKNDVGQKLAQLSGTYGLCWYILRNGSVKCDLRSVGDFNVAKLAQEFGGGGNKTTAGFTTTVERLREWGVI